MAEVDEFLVRLMAALDAHAEQGGSLNGVGRVVKRAAIECGVRGAADMHTGSNGGRLTRQVREHLLSLHRTVAGAHEACERFWQMSGVPEVGAALVHLEAARSMLEAPDCMPTLGALSARRALARSAPEPTASSYREPDRSPTMTHQPSAHL